MRVMLAAMLILATGVAWAEEKDDFVPLFNGLDLEGWELKEGKGDVKDTWTAREGVLVCKAGSGWLGTKEQYGDFVLKLEWRIPEGGNSGVFLRVPGVQKGVSPSTTGFEIQVLDDNSDKYKDKLKPYQYCGSIYHFAPASKKVFKGAGEWNRYEITCKGDQLTVVFNSEKVAEADASKNPEMAKRPKKGFIGLQNHGSGEDYRNVRIKVLTP
jgi:hypothetical protein